MNKKDYLRRKRALRYYLRYGVVLANVPNSRNVLVLQRDPKGRGVYITMRWNQQLVAIIDPNAVRIMAGPFSEVFANFAKRIGRRTINVKEIRSYRNMRASSRTNWLVEAPFVAPATQREQSVDPTTNRPTTTFTPSQFISGAGFIHGVGTATFDELTNHYTFSTDRSDYPEHSPGTANPGWIDTNFRPSQIWATDNGFSGTTITSNITEEL